MLSWFRQTPSNLVLVGNHEKILDSDWLRKVELLTMTFTGLDYFLLVIIAFLLLGVYAFFRTFFSELEEREDRFRATFEQAAVGIAHVSPTGDFLRVNKKFCEIIGYSRNELLNLSFQDITHPNDLDQDVEQTRRLLRGESDTYSMEKRYYRKDGELIWINLTVSLVRREKGEPRWFVSVIEEITERKKLQAERDRITETSEDLICTATFDAYFKYLNPAWVRLGYSEEELFSKPFLTIIHPDDRESTQSEVGRLETGKHTINFVNRLIYKDGSVHYVEWTASPVIHDNLLYAIGRDITERKEAEEELRQSEDRFRSLVDQSPVAIQIHRLDGKLIRHNAAFARLYGLGEETMIELYEKYNVREDLQAKKLGLDSFIERVFEGEEVVFPWFKYDGVQTLRSLEFAEPVSRTCWVETRGFPVKDNSGKVLSVVLLSVDITDRKEAEEELARSEQRFRSLMEQSPLAIEILSPEGQITQSNAAWRKLWGLTEEEAQQVKANYNMLSDEQTAKLGVRPLIKKAFAGEPTILPPIHYSADRTFKEIGLEYKTGENPWIQCHLYPVKDPNGEILYVVNTYLDITNLKEAEKEREDLQNQIVHAGRVNAMGELSASFAHEVNKPLGAVLSNAQAAARFLSQDSPDIDEVREALGDIVDGVKRTVEVVRKLRKMVHHTAPEFVPVRLQELIDEVLVFVKSETLLHNIQIQNSLMRDNTRIVCDRIQIQQVLINLITNAIHAMENVKDEKKFLLIKSEEGEGEHLKITIEDHGKGMSSDEINNAFVAFYTDKKDGMGMGLSISRRIVEAHGGRLWAEPNIEGGMSFHFTVPYERSTKA